ncbi:cellulose synthase-like protein E1 [Cucurbita pepo subsp. pepo]|uniref:cellulose synthase-like protein E1 n=1 Tax=Cucurbita pepo subsp. pepo TaxID=3664 RepID=UPI000C9D875F|nr:cellulose synthase-like protein E1 [Cucurbita pepo subsp. pepo]
MGSEGYSPLFETKAAKGRVAYRVFAASIFVGICLIWSYRVKFVGGGGGRWGWLGLFAAEIWFGFYWVITQAPRWNPIRRRTFKHKLSQRHEGEFPGVDIFVCTADPEMEPPAMVISTVLSVMAYDYPPEKLSVYLSDDAGSKLTYYALMEASQFAKHWIPFCKKFNIQPRSPAAYFASHTDHQSKEVDFIQTLYKDMENRINYAVKLGRVPDEIQSSSKGFSQWESYASRKDHDTFLQIVIDGRDPKAKDVEGSVLPTLVYLAREKRPRYFHNFKAGAMNALLRVSSQISNGQIILNVDCDMYSNNSDAIRDALCFLMDEEKGHEIAYVQFPQLFDNITKNEIYASSLRVINEVELPGLDSFGGPLYIGTGCFHRRDVLCGKKYSKGYRNDWNSKDYRNSGDDVNELEEKSKHLASCSYEENTEWGKEMGLRYGCPVEDVITGLSIQSQGWKSVYYNPERGAFLGVAPTSLIQTLVQHKRWSEGDLQILLSRYSPTRYARGKISLGLRMGYCTYCLWAVNSLATLYYSIIPSLYLLRGIPLFPQVSSPWLIPFTYVIFAKYAGSLVEYLLAGGTILGWWNEQRIWLYKRTSSYLFALIDTVLKTIGLSDSAFVITAKVTDQEASERYEKEIMEFGASSPMFTIIATVSLVNLLCFLGMVKKAVESGSGLVMTFQTMALQVVLCGTLVVINWPLYEGLFFRTDKGKIPSSLTIKSFTLALATCISFSLLL